MSDRPHLAPVRPGTRPHHHAAPVNGVDVLLQVYAGCIDGHEHMWNGRIEDALKDDD
ncbi:hypothetical protein AB0C84_21225 [Actinomadura sp. NPDC048955]|uniref:hypothetical protein n=1 Tax=Actinomadura sp. NPDC048955 TaxID=3158228 RepID=UPI0033E122E0